MGAGTIAHGAVRALISLVSGIIPLFMTSSYMSPTGSPFGSSFIPFQSFLPSQLTSAASSTVGSLGPLGSLGNYLPFAVGGGSAFVVWMILQQVLGHVQSLTYSRSVPKTNPADMMKQFGGMTGFGMQPPGTMPEKLPADITKTQYMILKTFQQGYRNPKDIEKQLSLDRKEIEKETVALKNNGYLTKDNKLTSKGLEILSQG